MLRRVLRTCAEFGVADVHLIHSRRVEKSFWQSPLLTPAKLREALQAGLERSGDTVLPQVTLHHRFRPFVEDQLQTLADGRSIYIAHPGDYPQLGHDSQGEAVVMIGPEGGFIPFEIDLAGAQGVAPRAMGSRILSVDTAVTAALARVWI
jgi:RsmE family RNA methyltransferase